VIIRLYGVAIGSINQLCSNATERPYRTFGVSQRNGKSHFGKKLKKSRLPICAGIELWYPLWILRVINVLSWRVPSAEFVAAEVPILAECGSVQSSNLGKRMQVGLIVEIVDSRWNYIYELK